MYAWDFHLVKYHTKDVNTTVSEGLNGKYYRNRPSTNKVMEMEWNHAFEPLTLLHVHTFAVRFIL